MSKVYYDKSTGNGWKQDSQGNWKYYEKDVLTKEDGTPFTGKWIWDKYKGAWNELLIKPTKKLVTKHGARTLKAGIGVTPGVSEFFERDSLKLKPYRENPVGTVHSVGGLAIQGIANKVKDITDKHTWEPGTEQTQTVFDAKEDLKIKKEKKLADLEAKYGGK
tara:strand:+ start:44 stop:532 length:489 start_codon:yes stop_codon:yes gene_type:complete